jgi:hypothetical protein
MVARATASKLDPHAAPRTAEAVRACPDAFLLGAVAHDGPFYLPKNERMVRLGDKLHGKDTDDAYAPMKRVLALPAGEAIPSSAIAFAAGALSHLAADTVFHPAVFYFTGFPSHSNRAVAGSHMFRHRAFEAAMDLHLLSAHGSGIDRKLKTLLGRVTAGSDAKGLLAALARFYGAEGSSLSDHEAKGIVEQAGKTQGLFSKAPLRLLARLLSLTHAETNADVSSLFYVRNSAWNGHFTSPRPYRDPISGVEGVFDAQDFFDSTVHRGLALVGNLERTLDGDPAAFPYPGPCLDSGHPVNDDQTMRYGDPALEASEIR